MTTSGSFTALLPHPLPLSIIFRVVQQCKADNTNCSHTIADMITLGFFFLLRAGEYARGPGGVDTPPFLMKHVQLFVGSCPIDFSTCSDEEFSYVTKASLEFHSKRNSRGKLIISLPMSGDPQWCPVLTLANRIRHLRQQNGSPETPLSAYQNGSTWINITTSMITTHLRAAATTMGLSSDDIRRISAHSIRPAGQMALYQQGVDTFSIQRLSSRKPPYMCAAIMLLCLNVFKC